MHYAALLHCIYTTCTYLYLVTLPMFFRFKMSKGFWDVPVRDAGKYIVGNVSLSKIPRMTGRMFEAYRARYVLPRNAGLTPLLHIVGFCIVVNYLIDYKKGHLKLDRWRKYH